MRWGAWSFPTMLARHSTGEVPQWQNLRMSMTMPESEQKPAASGTRAVDRALALLAIVADQGPITLTEAAREASLSVSTAMRLLRTLESWQFVSRNSDAQYGVGGRIVEIGAQAISQDRLYELSGQVLTELTTRTQETSYLGVSASDGTVVYLRQVESPRSIRHVGWVGKKVPIEGTSIGVVLSGQTPPAGYASNPAQSDDAVAFTAPVIISGEIVGALSVLVPSFRLSEGDHEHVGSTVRHHADKLSDLLMGRNAAD